MNYQIIKKNGKEYAVGKGSSCKEVYEPGALWGCGFYVDEAINDVGCNVTPLFFSDMFYCVEIVKCKWQVKECGGGFYELKSCVCSCHPDNQIVTAKFDYTFCPFCGKKIEVVE